MNSLIKRRCISCLTTKMKPLRITLCWSHTRTLQIRLFIYVRSRMHSETILNSRSEDPLESQSGLQVRFSNNILDISVSRVHAKITFHDGNFYLKDLDSKFGTVTRLWHPISIPNKKNYKIDIQVGRSSITISPSLKKIKKE